MPKFRFSNALRTARILWGALTGASLLLVVVAVTAHQKQRYPMPSSQAWMMLAVGVGVAVASFVLPMRFQSQTARMKRFETSDGGFCDPAAAIRRATVIGQTPFILSMALSQAVSLLGFVVAFLDGPLVVAAILFASGTILSAIRFPTPASLVGPFERAHNATFAASKGGPEALL